MQKANREAAKYRTALRAVEDELAKLKKADEDRKAKDMSETERAKKEADDARAAAVAARAEVAAAKAEAQIARSGVLEKYSRVMTADLLSAQTEDPSLDVNEWVKSYKADHAELFGATARAAEPTGSGGPPPNKAGQRAERIAQIEKELERLSSPVNMYRNEAMVQRVALSRELSKLRGSA